MESATVFKRKLSSYLSNWFQGAQQPPNEIPFTPDVVQIARLLQAVGYGVRYMDRSLPKEMCPVPGVPADCPAARIILMCPRSGLRMELDAPTSSCNCPAPDSGLGDSWTVSEIGSKQMEETVGTILPKMSSDISRSISQLLEYLFQVMSLFPDQNHNEIESKAVFGTSVSCSTSPVKTPATGIAVVTPNAPSVPKAMAEDGKTTIPGRYRSLDTLIASSGFPNELPEPGQLTPKEKEYVPQTDMEVDGDLNATLVQGPDSAKKFISKSSPAVHCADQFQRSDTFVFEDMSKVWDGAMEVQKTATANAKPTLLRSNTYVSISPNLNVEEPRSGPPPRRTPSPVPPVYSQSLVIDKLHCIQQNVNDIILMLAGNDKHLTNIGDVLKTSKAAVGAVQHGITDPRPIRCLSDYGSVPNLNRAATTVRSIPRPSFRRSGTIAAPATPTTSRRGATTTADSKTTASTTPLANATGSATKFATTTRVCSNRTSLVPPTSAQRVTRSSPSSTSGAGSTSKERRIASNRISAGPKPGPVRK